jgi:hypothetical protein
MAASTATLKSRRGVAEIPKFLWFLGRDGGRSAAKKAELAIGQRETRVSQRAYRAKEAW